MTATAWLSVAISAFGVVLVILFAWLRAEIRAAKNEIVGSINTLNATVTGLSTRVGLLETRVQSVEVVLMKPPDVAEVR